MADIKLWSIIFVQIVGFALLLVKSYFTEKGKNLATKEDVGEITQKVESIKTSLAQKTEELKSDLLYRSEHLIHLRAAERAAIINYYKATWVLVLNFTKNDFAKNEIDDFDRKDGEVSELDLRRYVSESESTLTKIKEELSNVKYLRDISESELMFFYDDKKLKSIMDGLNLSLSGFERSLVGSINSLLQVSKEVSIKVNAGQPPKEIIIEAQGKRSEILSKWYEDRYGSLSNIRTFNENLKKLLHLRLKSLTS